MCFSLGIKISEILNNSNTHLNQSIEVVENHENLYDFFLSVLVLVDRVIVGGGGSYFVESINQGV